MDTCKLGPGLYQYTSIDDCTRYRVLRIYKRRTAANTLDFLDCVIEEMPFPIQRIQTDRGREFFAEKVQKKLMQQGIKFRPNKPGSPLIHLRIILWNKPLEIGLCNKAHANYKMDLEIAKLKRSL